MTTSKPKQQTLTLKDEMKSKDDLLTQSKFNENEIFGFFTQNYHSFLSVTNSISNGWDINFSIVKENDISKFISLGLIIKERNSTFRITEKGSKFLTYYFENELKIKANLKV